MVESNHKAFRFPGGEAHVAFDSPTATIQVAYLTGGDSNDLMTLAMWADACHRRGLRTIAAIPYLPGARQDRGTPLGAKVFADFINSMHIDDIVCLDPHSDVMPALLNNVTVVSLDELDVWSRYTNGSNPVVGVIAPDAGARKRAELVAGVMGVPVFQALKHRNFATGKLSSFSCEPLPETGRLLVVDDICDGGGTFMGLAEVTGLPPERLALWVTHGVFSGGAPDLVNHYHDIATTDSHPGAVAGRCEPLHVTNLRDLLIAKIEGR